MGLQPPWMGRSLLWRLGSRLLGQPWILWMGPQLRPQVGLRPLVINCEDKCFPDPWSPLYNTSPQAFKNPMQPQIVTAKQSYHRALSNEAIVNCSKKKKKKKRKPLKKKKKKKKKKK